MAQALLTISIHYYVIDAGSDFSFKRVAQNTVASRSLLELFAGKFRCFTKSHNPRNVLRACAAFAFLVSTNILSLNFDTPPDVKRSNAFRCVQLVPRDRQ